jgi:hypothetical protein
VTIDIAANVAALAATLGGHAGRGSTWFDGFWDFVIEHRPELDAAWEIQGDGWAIVFFPPSVAAPLLRAHVFVEAKDSRPGIRAPWPVSSIVLAPGTSARTAERDRHDRPFHAGDAALVRAFGFEPVVGYWGVHASRSLNLSEPVELFERLFAELPRVLDACRHLALALE